MLKILKNNIFLFKYTLKYTNYIWWTLIDGIVNTLYGSVFTVVFIKLLYNMIEQEEAYEKILILIAVIGIGRILIFLFGNNFDNFVMPKIQLKLNQRVSKELFTKAMSVDLSCYDDPEFYNDYIWVLNQFESEIMSISADIGNFISTILGSAIIVTLMATIDIAIIFVVIFAVIATFTLNYIRTKISHKKGLEIRTFERKADYVDRVFYLSEYAQEIRLSKVSDILTKDFNDAKDKQVKTHIKYAKKFIAMGFAQNLISYFIMSVCIMLYLIYKITHGNTITFGDFAASLAAIGSLYRSINNLINYALKAKGHSLYADRLKKFLTYTSYMQDAPDARDVPDFEKLTLKNVNFSYRGSEQDALKDINIEIRKNEKIALVGYNGAGKSTLVKLIMRLYDPTSGELGWNDNNVKDLKIVDYRSQYSTVFQDFKLFALTIAENVKMDIVTEEDVEKIEQALKKSRFSDKLADLPKGIDTQVTKEFDPEGTNLSGGELQKIAIARTFLRKSDLIILDEPSANLDPISEYELNQTMMSAAFDKTVIFISHRLSTTVMADRIYMMDNGRIIEAGSHAELMAQKGKYAEMFRMQAEKYQEDYAHA